MKKVFVDFEKCLGCLTCELACATAHSEAKTFLGAVLGGERPPVSVHVIKENTSLFPLQCRHCSDALCSRVCMTGALSRDEEASCVTFNPEKCLGCMMCVMVCPFGAITEAPSHKIAKCDLCEKVGEPSCVSACPTGAMSFIEVNDFAQSRRREFVISYQQDQEE